MSAKNGVGGKNFLEVEPLKGGRVGNKTTAEQGKGFGLMLPPLSGMLYPTLIKNKLT
jgi:hypothetical protein